VTAIILAGGKSRRMGTNKAFLRLGDTSLIENQVKKLCGIFDEIIISANDYALYERFKLPVVHDIFPGRKGPLAGICSCLKHASYPYAFVIACDMPNINENLILFLQNQIEENYDIIVPKTSRGPEPLHAFYSKNCIPVMEECLKKDDLRLVDFLSMVRARYVTEVEFAVINNSARAFINLNTLEEYKKYCKIVK